MRSVAWVMFGKYPSRSGTVAWLRTVVPPAVTAEPANNTEVPIAAVTAVLHRTNFMLSPSFLIANFWPDH